jgi:hypothetical protein
MLWPSRFMRPATTELSTPPLMATARRGLEVDRGEPPEVSGGAGDGGDEGVDLVDGVAEAEGKADGGLGLFAGKADAGEDVGGLDGAGGNRRRRRRRRKPRRSRAMTMDSPSMPAKRMLDGVGKAGSAGAVDGGVGDAGEDALFKLHGHGVEGEGIAGEFAGGTEGDGTWHVFGTGAAALLMAAAELARAERDAFADVEGADALGGVELVAGDGVEIDEGDGGREFAGGLYAIGVEESAGRAGDGGKGFEVLDGANLIVGMHDGDEDGFGAEGLAEGIRRDDAAGVGGQVGDVNAGGIEFSAGGENGGVLNVGGDDVLAGGGGDAEEGEVIGLGAAAGEDDLLGGAAEEGGGLAAGLFRGPVWRAGRPDGYWRRLPYPSRRMGSMASQHRRGDWGRRVVIEIKAFHQPNSCFYFNNGDASTTSHTHI